MTPCHHRRWKLRACRDAHHLSYVCQECQRVFMLPLLWPKPRLRWCKHALRVARYSQTVGPRRYEELSCRAVDVPYLHSLLMHAGYSVQVPEFSSVLMVRGGGNRRDPKGG